MPKGSGKPKMWIQKARSKMEQKGTVGALRNQAKRAGKMDKEGDIKTSYLEKLKKKGTPQEKKRANFALNMRKLKK